MSEELVLNPYGKVVEVDDDDGVVGYRVFAPVRGRGLQSTVIARRPATRGTVTVDPALCAILERLHGAAEDVEVDDADVERLHALGLLVEPAQVSTPVMYACPLDADAAAAPPESVDEPAGSLIVNPSLRVADRLDAPDDGNVYDEEILARWVRDRAIAWVQDGRTGAWFPYHVRPELAGLVASLEPGETPGMLDPDVRRALIAADILVPRDRAAQVRRWDAELEAARRCYRENGYAVARRVLPPLHVAALGRYYRALIEEGFVSFGDGQVPRRYWRHQEEVLRFFHLQYWRFFERIVGASIKPSYGYLGSYRPGAVLERHVDRAQCELTASMLVDFTPYRGGPTGWLLYLEENVNPRETFAIDQALGDVVIYRGRELAHYREALPDGCTSTSFFLHYVPSSFTGLLT